MSRPVADVLRRAADRVAKGWCQGQFYDANGGVCPVAAIRESVHDGAMRNAACDALRDYLDSGIMGWNDKADRQQAEVVAALRAAADAAEGGGK